MGLFKFTSGRRIDEFAKELAGEFSRLYPLSGTAKGGRSSAKAVETALGQIYERAKAFREARRLGVLNRARLARSFQNELLRLGYPGEMVSKVTAALLANALSG